MLFIGDSITDCSRSRPIGKAIQADSGIYNATGLGSGYVSIIDNLLIAGWPQLDLTLFNLGCNGNRITDLQNRWQSDVINQKPDWLIILIGINDVWRQFDRPQDPNQVLIQEFETIYRTLINKSDVSPSNIILMSPYFLETNLEEPMRKEMDRYAVVVKNLAIEHQCPFIDLQKEFDHFLKFRSVNSISVDKIHLNKAGHTIIAKSFLQLLKHQFD